MLTFCGPAVSATAVIVPVGAMTAVLGSAL
jgi:hypothetical protein